MCRDIFSRLETGWFNIKEEHQGERRLKYYRVRTGGVGWLRRAVLNKSYITVLFLKA